MQSPPWWKHLRDVLILPFTVAVVIPYLIHDQAQAWIPQAGVVRLAGGATILCGAFLLGWTVLLFAQRGRGTLAPWTPTQKLVVTGPYRHCRNPMITGVLFILIGEALLWHSTNVLIEAGAFLLINTIYFILKEEPDLLLRFGEEYRVYKQHVPRWIPRIRPH